MSVFGVISDTHYHNWSAFSSLDEDGINMRLRIILDKTVEAAKKVKEQGGDILVHCGDMFHVRGSVAPSVLNPTLETYHHIIHDIGVRVYALPGNHDLETKEARRFMSASEALEGVGVNLADDGMMEIPDINGIMIPWTPNLEALRESLRTLQTEPDHQRMNVFIHAPVDGVLMGIPDHGLTFVELEKFGFRTVFAGHYHNFKNHECKVVSVGALTHQTWSDIGTIAGYNIVETKGSVPMLTHFTTDAPQFIELDMSWDYEEVKRHCKGNYVRASALEESEEAIQELREYLTGSLHGVGAKGVIVKVNKKSSREVDHDVSIDSSGTLEESVNEYIKKKGFSNPTQTFDLCKEILEEVGG